MGKSAQKNRGTSYEYRVADWFQARKKWSGRRIPLSGASAQIEESVGRHDVRTWHDDLPIFLQIECKKRGTTKKKVNQNQMEIQSIWIDKLEWYKDELLVFATNRSPHYAFLPLKRFFQILGRKYDISYDKKNTYNGAKQFALKRELIDEAEDKRFHLKWREQEYVALYLEDFVELRETADLHDELSFEDIIKRLTSLERGVEFEKLNLDELDYKQKRLLYSKLEELKSGTLISPMKHAQEQFWMEEDAFILNCPFCKENVRTKDLKKGEEGTEIPPSI